MSKKEFVIICLRLIGIYILISGISSLPNMFSMVINSSFSQGYILASPILYIAIGVALYILAPKLSKYIIEFSDAEESSVSISANEKTARIALLVLGFYIFSRALPQFIQVGIDIGMSYQRMAEVSQTLKWYEHKWFYIVPPFVQIAIAALLIVGPDKIIEFSSRFDDNF